MAETGLTIPEAELAPHPRSGSAALQIALFVGYWVGWDVFARLGLFYEGAVPTSVAILRELWFMLGDPALYTNLAVTALEVIAALAIGAGLGLALGLLGGAVRIVGDAFQPYVHYLAPAPKIIFLPILLLFFGVGPAMKVALGAFSAFFPMAIASLAAVRQVDPVLVRVGRSLHLTRWQMAVKIYLPAMRAPVLTGLRLAFGLAFIGVLLAEIKFSNQGLGYMAIQMYNHMEIAALYALLTIIFSIAGAVNAAIAHLARAR